MEKYTLEELEAFAKELNEEIERRKFDLFKEQVRDGQWGLPKGDDLKVLCQAEYGLGGTVSAIRCLRTFVQGASLSASKRLIEEWAKTNGWKYPDPFLGS